MSVSLVGITPPSSPGCQSKEWQIFYTDPLFSVRNAGGADCCGAIGAIMPEKRK